MRVGTFFLACLSAAAGVALLAALVTVATEWRRFADAGRAREATTAISAGLDAAEALSLEGAAHRRHLMADAAADATAQSTLGRARAASDGALSAALAHLAATDLTVSETLTRIIETLTGLRAMAEAELRGPKSQRDFDRLQAITSGFDDLPARIDRALDPVERALTTLAGAAANAIWMARRAATTRELAGRRSRFYISAIAVREPIDEDDLERMAELAGRIDQLGREVHAAVARVGDPPRLVAALDEVSARFEGAARTLHEPLDAAARGGGVYPLTIDQYVEQVTPLIQSVLAIRDAAVAEALGHARATRAAALTRLLLSLGLVVLVTAVIAAVGTLFGRRVGGPLAALTGAVTPLAGGGRALALRGPGGRAARGRDGSRASDRGHPSELRSGQRRADPIRARRRAFGRCRGRQDRRDRAHDLAAVGRGGAHLGRRLDRRADRRGRRRRARPLGPDDRRAGRALLAHRRPRGRRSAQRRPAYHRPGDGVGQERRGRQVDQRHREPDQPAGAQRHDRGGARRRRRQGLRRGRDRGQELGRADRPRDRGYRRPDRSDPGRDPGHHREPARDRRHDHRNARDLGRA